MQSVLFHVSCPLVNAPWFVSVCIMGINVDKKTSPVLLQLRYDTLKVPLTLKETNDKWKKALNTVKHFFFFERLCKALTGHMILQ